MKLTNLFLQATSSSSFTQKYEDKNHYHRLRQDCLDVLKKIKAGHNEPIHKDPKTAQNVLYMEGYRQALKDVAEYIQINKWRE